MAWISTAEPSNPIVVTATANLVGSDRAIARFYDRRESLLKALAGGPDRSSLVNRMHRRNEFRLASCEVFMRVARNMPELTSFVCRNNLKLGEYHDERNDLER